MQVHEQRTVNLYLGNQSKKNFNFRVFVKQGHRKPRPLADFEKALGGSCGASQCSLPCRGRLWRRISTYPEVAETLLSMRPGFKTVVESYSGSWGSGRSWPDLVRFERLFGNLWRNSTDFGRFVPTLAGQGPSVADIWPVMARRCQLLPNLGRI